MVLAKLFDWPENKVPDDRVLLGIGDFQLSVRCLSLNDMKTRYEYDWAEIKTIGEIPKLMYMGEGCHTMTVTGTILPQIGGYAAGVSDNLIVAEARQHEPLEVVDAAGRSLGRWVIVGIDVNEVDYFVDKKLVAPRKTEVTITMKYYGENIEDKPSLKYKQKQV